MRILLVQAFTALDLELVFPIGLSYLASHIPDEHHVEIFDNNLIRDESDPYKTLGEKVIDFKPDVVGISLRNIKVASPGLHADDFEPQQKTVAMIRKSAPNATIIAGGTAFSLYSQAFMRKLPEVDIGFWGEGEERFPALLKDLDNPEKIAGIWHRKNGDPAQYTGDPPSLNFRKLKNPRKDMVPIHRYAESSYASIGLQAKRGCALHCIHCSDTYLLGHTLRMRSPEDIVDEMEEWKNLGVNQIFFCDQIFNIPVSHAINICKEIVRRNLNIRWAAWFNEKANTLPDELIVWVKRAGCGLLSFSPDHVDDRMLKNLDKNFRYKDLQHTYRIGKKHNIDVEYSFFLNSPGEDLKSLLMLFRFLAEAKLHLGSNLRMFTLLMMQPIRIYPHSRLFDLAIETGMIDKDADLIEGQFWNPGTLSWAANGVQTGAQTVYAWRERMRSITGNQGKNSSL